MLDPKALTIGFARRFATYKRATLLLSQPDRLRRLLLSTDQPVQFVFAGKAHPADDLGKALIRDLVHFARDPTVRHRFVFVDDYDIALARYMYQGCDVWLNNPRRPQEACGTSGMKAAMNGALNCSILDGWWDECFDGTNGWAITSAEGEADLAKRDEIEANSLFELLEHQIVPLFYQRTEGPTPRGWVRRMKASLRTLCPQVTAARMVRDYVDPALRADRRARRLASTPTSYAAAKALAAWKARVLDGVARRARRRRRVRRQRRRPRRDRVRSTRRSTSASSQPEDVTVQLLHGPVGQGDELVDPALVPMTLVEQSPARRALPRRARSAARRPLRLHRPRAARPSRPRPARRARPHRLGLNGGAVRCRCARASLRASERSRSKRSGDGDRRSGVLAEELEQGRVDLIGVGEVRGVRAAFDLDERDAVAAGRRAAPSPAPS